MSLHLQILSFRDNCWAFDEEVTMVSSDTVRSNNRKGTLDTLRFWQARSVFECADILKLAQRKR